MTWKDENSLKNVDDLFSKLQSLSGSEKPIAYRGQADIKWNLQTSLDRLLNKIEDYNTRLAEESAIIEKFRVLANEYLGEIEVRRLNESLANNKVSALTVMQHYRAPTRLLDWTSSPWIAVYFAAIEHHETDGAVWWFKQETFEKEVGKRWSKYKMERYPSLGNEINLNDTAFKNDGPPWITKLHCIIPFHRIEVQQAFFTVAGRLGLDHGKLISDIFVNKGDIKYGRVIVPSSYKQNILDRLRIMNINSKTLDYPGADIVGYTLTRDLRETKKGTSVD
jgi:hypothetical protein